MFRTAPLRRAAKRGSSTRHMRTAAPQLTRTIASSSSRSTCGGDGGANAQHARRERRRRAARAHLRSEVRVLVADADVVHEERDIVVELVEHLGQRLVEELALVGRARHRVQEIEREKARFDRVRRAQLLGERVELGRRARDEQQVEAATRERFGEALPEPARASRHDGPLAELAQVLSVQKRDRESSGERERESAATSSNLWAPATTRDRDGRAREIVRREDRSHDAQRIAREVQRLVERKAEREDEQDEQRARLDEVAVLLVHALGRRAVSRLGLGRVVR